MVVVVKWWLPRRKTWTSVTLGIPGRTGPPVAVRMILNLCSHCTASCQDSSDSQNRIPNTMNGSDEGRSSQPPHTNKLAHVFITRTI